MPKEQKPNKPPETSRMRTLITLRDVAIPIRLPTGELTGYIGITEAKPPKEFHLSSVVTFPEKSVQKAPHLRGLSLSFCRWYRPTSRRTGSCPFRSMWSGRLDCRSDCRSSVASGPCRQSCDGPWTYDPSVQVRPCWRARTQRLMLLS